MYLAHTKISHSWHVRCQTKDDLTTRLHSGLCIAACIVVLYAIQACLHIHMTNDIAAFTCGIYQVLSAWNAVENFDI